jgi:hypothetical protein
MLQEMIRERKQEDSNLAGTYKNKKNGEKIVVLQIVRPYAVVMRKNKTTSVLRSELLFENFIKLTEEESR